MENNTSTTLGELKIGDRFYFACDNKKVEEAIVGKTPLGSLLYNRINKWGYKMRPVDFVGLNSREVIFLRNANDRSSGD